MPVFENISASHATWNVNKLMLLATIRDFIKLLKRGFTTDLNLKRFPKFSNRISGPSSGDNSPLPPEEEPEIRFENLGNLFKFRSVLNPFLAIL